MAYKFVYHKTNRRGRERPQSSHGPTRPRQPVQDSLHAIGSPKDRTSPPRDFQPLELDPNSVNKKMISAWKQRSEQQGQSSCLAMARQNQEGPAGDSWADQWPQSRSSAAANRNSRAAGSQRGRRNGSHSDSSRAELSDVRRPPSKIPAMKNELRSREPGTGSTAPSKPPPPERGEPSDSRRPVDEQMRIPRKRRAGCDGDADLFAGGSRSAQQKSPPHPNVRRGGRGAARAERQEAASRKDAPGLEGATNETAISLCDNDNSETEVEHVETEVETVGDEWFPARGQPESQQDARKRDGPTARGDDSSTGAEAGRRRSSRNAVDGGPRQTTKSPAAARAAGDDSADDEIQEVAPPPNRAAATSSPFFSSSRDSQSGAPADGDAPAKPPPDAAAGGRPKAKSGSGQKRPADDISPAEREQPRRSRGDPKDASCSTIDGTEDVVEVTMSVLDTIHKDSDAALPPPSGQGAAPAPPPAADSKCCEIDDSDDEVQVHQPARSRTQQPPVRPRFGSLSGTCFPSTVWGMASEVITTLSLNKHNSKSAVRRQFGGGRSSGKPIPQPGSSLRQADDSASGRLPTGAS
jgi:hypothetical protein